MDLSRLVPLHYPTNAAKWADLVIHILGLALALVGGIYLVNLVYTREPGAIIPIGVYAGALVAMLTFSLAYNFSHDWRRPLLRRLDHAGIFLMIAGSYTPFTTIALSGAWAWGMTAAVWTIATLGILGKLFLPAIRERIWLAIYLTLGWIVLIALGPMVTALSKPAIALLALGGFIYTVGVVFHVKEHLRYSRSIWHGHVIAAAGVHWAAVLVGTVT